MGETLAQAEHSQCPKCKATYLIAQMIPGKRTALEQRCPTCGWNTVLLYQEGRDWCKPDPSLEPPAESDTEKKSKAGKASWRVRKSSGIPMPEDGSPDSRYSRARRAKLRKQGRCERCGKACNRLSFTTCDACRLKRREKARGTYRETYKIDPQDYRIAREAIV